MDIAKKSRSGMVGHYYTPEIKDMDGYVMARHPFLRFWGYD
jgi:hypothetical protein